MNTVNEPKPDDTQKPAEVALAEDGLPEVFTEEYLARLDEYERKAILAEQDGQDFSKIDQTQQDDAGDADDADGDTNQQQAKPQDAPKETPKQEAPAEPVIVKPDTSKFEQEVQRLKGEAVELRKKLLDGDISDDEYATKSEELEAKIVDQRAEIVAAEKLYNDAVQKVENQAAQAWYNKVDGYMTENDILRGEKVLPIFDAALKALTASPQYAAWTDDQIIRHAHRMTIIEAEAHGIIQPGTAQEPTPPKQQQRQADPRTQLRTDTRPDVPTLAGLSQEEGSGVDDSQFAMIDRAIDGPPEEYETSEKMLRQLARKDPEAFDRFLRGA